MLNTHRPLRVAVLCSQRAPGLLYLLNRSPYRGSAFEIVCCLTSEPTFAEDVRVERRGVPIIAHPIADFYAARGFRNRRDLVVRAEYDRQTAALIEPHLPDVVLLDGYLHLVTAPLLNRFWNRVLNLHFSDLTIRARGGSAPRYPGIRAVRDAIAGGSPETRATVHLANEEPDAGPPLVVSWPFPVSPLVEELRTLDASDVFRAYVFAHEQWMLRTVSGPLVASALRLVASGALDLDAVADSHGVRNPWVLDRRGCLLAPSVEHPAALAG